MDNINDVILSIPEWMGIDNITYEPLNGGLSNVTYKVNVNGCFYVLRINGNQNDFLYLTREEELNAMIKASELGIAPAVFPTPDSKHILITEFISGKPFVTEEMFNASIIKKITSTLLKVHSIDNVDRKCSPFDLIKRYLDGAKDLNVTFPDKIFKHFERIESIHLSRSKDKENTNKYCHNDFHPGHNMICSNGSIKVIDWELSGVGDVFFDIATISSDFGFSKEQDIILLESYFGKFDKEQYSILNDMKYICMIREISWAILHEGLNINRVNHDMDYMGFAKSVLDRLDEGIVSLI